MSRYFPILDGTPIPWDAIAPHEAQAQRNHGGQTLERLADRGGLCPSEAVAVMSGGYWVRMDPSDARRELARLVGEYEARASLQLERLRSEMEIDRAARNIAFGLGLAAVLAAYEHCTCRCAARGAEGAGGCGS